MPPKASIILLAYNHQNSVARAIESLLAQQTDYNYEILIADDCSTDRTREIAQQYADRYPQIIRMMPPAPNKGLVNNYFDALMECRGEYISDCAADDYWLDTSLLRTEIEMLDSDPSLSVVFPDVAENGTQLHSSMPRYARWMRPHVTGREILLGTLNNTTALPYQLSAALYRKSSLMSVLEQAPDMVRNPECGVEDLPVIAALASQGDAAYTPLIGYHYTVDSTETISNNLSPAKAFRFYSRLLAFTPKLAKFYGIPLTDLNDHFQQKYSY
ncbi:MAG: glycosyltransferase, partial [Muribaculaceae bacterium]|nr:glycosyltransferase [Muribaculaceae bacterium]